MLEGIKKAQFQKSLNSLQKEIKKLLLEGFIKETTENLCLTNKGLLFYDDVSMELI